MVVIYRSLTLETWQNQNRFCSIESFGRYRLNQLSTTAWHANTAQRVLSSMLMVPIDQAEASRNMNQQFIDHASVGLIFLFDTDSLTNQEYSRNMILWVWGRPKFVRNYIPRLLVWSHFEL